MPRMPALAHHLPRGSGPRVKVGMEGFNPGPQSSRGPDPPPPPAPSCSFPGHQKEMLTFGVSAQGAGTFATRSVSLHGPARQAE